MSFCPASPPRPRQLWQQASPAILHELLKGLRLRDLLGVQRFLIVVWKSCQAQERKLKALVPQNEKALGRRPQRCSCWSFFNILNSGSCCWALCSPFCTAVRSSYWTLYCKMAKATCCHAGTHPRDSGKSSADSVLTSQWESLCKLLPVMFIGGCSFCALAEILQAESRMSSRGVCGPVHNLLFRSATLRSHLSPGDGVVNKQQRRLEP